MKTLRKILQAVFEGGQEYHDAPSDGSFEQEAEAELVKAVEVIIGPDADNVMNRMLQEEQRKRLKQFVGGE